MRKVTKTYHNPPGELGPITEHNNRLIRIYNGSGSYNKEKIYGKIYGSNPVRNRLAHLYHKKCAYCESYEPEFEIEHYRPKKGIDGEIHEGYFWLCYEWSNLIPACHDCNKKRSKSTKFPIEGTRVTSPTIISNKYQFTDHNLLSRRLKREYPLLIHPEEPDFDPSKYFKYDRTGWMIPAANNTSRNFRRAKATINDIVRLNRDNLYLNERKNDLRVFEKRLIGIHFFYFQNFINHGAECANSNLQFDFHVIMSEIKEKGKPNKEYSFFWNYVFDNFYFFLPKRLKKRPKDRIRFKKLIEDHS
jgi:uncharacterized protein (TIGR02646 family)